MPQNEANFGNLDDLDPILNSILSYEVMDQGGELCVLFDGDNSPRAHHCRGDSPDAGAGADVQNG